MKCYAIMRGHTTYSLRPWKDPWGRKTPFRYQGFCDGQPCGLFRTKADFEAFVNADSPPPVADHPRKGPMPWKRERRWKATNCSRSSG